MEIIMRWTHYLGIALILFTLCTTMGTSEADKYKPLKEFSQVMDLIESTYVREVNREELVKGAIKGMLSNLDPHSAYLDKDAYQEMQVETTGEFTGIGIQITIKNGRLTVVSPIEDTPAFSAGLKAGDIILEINGEPTRDITIMDAVHKIRGPKGTKVELTILHEQANAPEKVTIKRDVIPVHSVKSVLLQEGYLYLRITNFNENTTKELHKALKKHKARLQGLILDLRNNPGGLLQQAVSVADIFMGDGKIVYTKGKVEKSQMSFAAESKKSDIEIPMVVLINAGTASASEIVAGALQDQKRALVLGTKSFGKGSVQTIIPLADGSAIKITTAKYYTPNGRSIQAEGIVPDLKIPFIQKGDQENTINILSQIREKDLEGHLENGRDQNASQEIEIKEKAMIMLENDNQLRLAFQIVKSLPAIKALK